MARRPNWRLIKTHRNYTVEGASQKLGVAKGTILRWLKDGLLRAVMDKRPFLIMGHDLIAFGKQRRAPKQTCALNECYCFTCRSPQAPAGRLADLVPVTNKTGDLEALCSTCGGMMHKRVSLSQQDNLAQLLDLKIRPARLPFSMPDAEPFCPANAAPPLQSDSHERP